MLSFDIVPDQSLTASLRDIYINFVHLILQKVVLRGQTAFVCVCFPTHIPKKKAVWPHETMQKVPIDLIKKVAVH